GSGTGGTSVLQNNGTLEADRIRVANVGSGGIGTTQGGAGFGGSSTFNTNGAATSSTDNDISLEAAGIGGDATGVAGTGGDATGGTVELGVYNGASLTADLLYMLAAPTAGSGATPGTQTGGTGAILDNNEFGTFSVTTLEVDTGTFTDSDNLARTNFYLTVDGDFFFDDYTITGDLSVTTDGNLTVGVIDAGTAYFEAGSNLNVSDVTSGGLSTFFAQGTATFTGTVSATEIKVTSGDIDVQAGANLGLNGITTLITLEPLNLGDILIGGVDNPDSSWQLSEAGFINADAIVVDALYGNNVIVDDFVIEGSQTVGGGVSSVTLNTDGTVKIIGAVEFTNAGANDVLAINSDETIQVVTDAGGSISMLDANGDLAGTLELTAHDIWIADQAIITQLEANPNYAGRNADLAANGGAVAPNGYIGADGVEVTMLGSSFLVQNSGTPTAFAGVTVGDGGLTLVNQGSEPATITAFGQQIQSNGTVVSGDEFANSVQTTGSVAPGSTINGCEMGVVCGAVTPPPVPPPPV
ncbi:MAG: hypothetical protein LH616_14105, partial [Ilumatobacteraceae bacterium]|nr:hypothetical protein [Ilumatobacteraceae bacterium]